MENNRLIICYSHSYELSQVTPKGPVGCGVQTGSTDIRAVLRHERI